MIRFRPAAAREFAYGALSVELRSVNHRYLSLAIKAPTELAQFEAEIRDRLRRDFERGHFSVSIRWLHSAEGGGAARVDRDGVEAALGRLRELETLSGLPGLTLDLLARQPEVFAVGAAAAVAPEWAAIEPVLAGAVAELQTARRREGQVLSAELTLRLGMLRTHAGAVGALAPARLVRERDRLRAAVEQLLGATSVDEQRLNQELALLADRLDLTEESVRLTAHLDAAEAALGAGKPVGKQLGFLAQEIGREVNTIGSKANDAAIQHLAVEMKGELERFREQLENLE